MPELLLDSNSDNPSSSDYDTYPVISPSIVDASATDTAVIQSDPCVIPRPIIANTDDRLSFTPAVTGDDLFSEDDTNWAENQSGEGVQEVWEFPEGHVEDVIDWPQARYITFGELASQCSI